MQKIFKICLVSECLSTGGAERVAAVLSNFFVNQGVKIHHIILIDSIEYEFSGEILNLGKIKNKGIFNKFSRFLIWKNYIKNNNFDYIIDFRAKNNFFQEFIISRFIYIVPTIYTVHSYMDNLYFSKNKLLVHFTHKNAYSIIAVSKSIQSKLFHNYGLKKLNLIYNPINLKDIQNKSLEILGLNFKYIIAAGRMNNNVKQFDLLIHSYSNSCLPKKNIKLIILGDGILIDFYKKIVLNLNLKDKVLFYGHVKNPFQYFKNANFFVLTSKFEGFPMAILESLACQTPVISFDCFSGPNEIIINNENGILVENQNTQKLTSAMNLLTKNLELCNHCKSNALKSIETFSIENIGHQWLQLLEIK